MDKHKKKKEQQGKAKELQKKVSVNTYEVLTEAGYKPAQSLVYRKVLATSEQGRKYALEISEQKETAYFRCRMPQVTGRWSHENRLSIFLNYRQYNNPNSQRGILLV